MGRDPAQSSVSGTAASRFKKEVSMSVMGILNHQLFRRRPGDGFKLLGHPFFVFLVSEPHRQSRSAVQPTGRFLLM